MMRALTASERMTVARALGRNVLKLADQIFLNFQKDGTAPSWLFREFLQALHDGAGDTAMSSPVGLILQTAILGKIGDKNGNDDASERRRSPGGGFPSRRQF